MHKETNSARGAGAIQARRDEQEAKSEIQGHAPGEGTKGRHDGEKRSRNSTARFDVLRERERHPGATHSSDSSWGRDVWSASSARLDGDDRQSGAVTRGGS